MGFLTPNAIMFKATLAEDPLAVREAPAEPGLAALQDWGGGFPGGAVGEAAWDTSPPGCSLT